MGKPLRRLETGRVSCTRWPWPSWRKIGIDIGDGRSKHVDELAYQPFDLVVTVCDSAKETMPHPTRRRADAALAVRGPGRRKRHRRGQARRRSGPSAIGSANESNDFSQQEHRRMDNVTPDQVR